MKINYKNKTILTSEVISEEQLNLILQQEALKLQLDKVATQELLLLKLEALRNAKTQYPLCPKAIFELQNDILKLRNGILAIDNLSEELGFTV